jgi:hypothetical protein
MIAQYMCKTHKNMLTPCVCIETIMGIGNNRLRLSTSSFTSCHYAINSLFQAQNLLVPLFLVGYQARNTG